jgi:hypothetical protein
MLKKIGILISKFQRKTVTTFICFSERYRRSWFSQKMGLNKLKVLQIQRCKIQKRIISSWRQKTYSLKTTKRNAHAETLDCDIVFYRYQIAESIFSQFKEKRMERYDISVGQY